MVATLEIYLPEIDKTVWVNCDGDSVGIGTADVVWGEDDADAYDCAVIHVCFYDDMPEEVTQWLPMINESLVYYIDQTLSDTRMCSTVSVPVKWLPDSIRKNADVEYLDFLQKRGKCAEINKNRDIPFKVFVSTEKTQGQSETDFCNVPEGKFVRFASTNECLVGFDCHTGTTTLKVTETDITFEQYINKYSSSIKKAFGLKDIDDELLEEMESLVEIASEYRIGSIVEFSNGRFYLRK